MIFSLLSFIVLPRRVRYAGTPGTGRVFIPVLAILLFLEVSSGNAQNIMSLYYPPDKTVMEYDLLGIVIALSGDAAERLNISINGDTKTIMAAPGRLYQCFTVKITPGINRIVITAEGNDTPLAPVEFSVFHRSDLIGEFSNVPPGYKKDRFHVKDHGECAGCHSLAPTVSDRAPAGPKALSDIVSGKVFDKNLSTCYSCHKGIAEYPYVHGPVSVWSCLSCHDTGAVPVYTVEKPDAEVCYRCHAEQDKRWKAKKYTHGPVTLGKCTICHNPHASDFRFTLYKPGWDLCVTCHAEKAKEEHVISGDFSTAGHPTRNRMDPLRPGEEFTCASCHDPHASNSPTLFTFDVKDIFHLCLKCHNV